MRLNNFTSFCLKM